MSVLVPITTHAAFANLLGNFLSGSLHQTYWEAAGLPPLFYTPHLSDPNPNLLYAMLKPSSNGGMSTCKMMAQNGLSYFPAEWRIVQGIINSATVDIGEDVKTDKKGDFDADQLRECWLRYHNQNSMAEDANYPLAETSLHSAIVLAFSDDRDDLTEAIKQFREASALFGRYGLFSAASMVRELAWQTRMVKPHDINDVTYRHDMETDHFFAADYWRKTLACAPADYLSHGLRLCRGLQNGFEAEKYKGTSIPDYPAVDDILLLSALWYAQRHDPEREIHSLLHLISRKLRATHDGRDMSSHEWQNVASMLEKGGKLLSEETLLELANTAKRFADIRIQRRKPKPISVSGIREVPRAIQSQRRGEKLAV